MIVVVLCDKVDGFVDCLFFLLLFFFPSIGPARLSCFPFVGGPECLCNGGKTLGIGWSTTKKYVSVVHNFVCLHLSF